MAPFKIHTDDQIENKIPLKYDIQSDLPKKVQLHGRSKPAEKRTALRDYNNGVRDMNKRPKIHDKRNNEKVTITKSIKKKVDEQKADTHSCEIANFDVEEKESLPLSPYDKKNYSGVSFSTNSLGNEEYSKDVMEYYKKIEWKALPRIGYMEKQLYISWNMRSVLIDWLISVTEEYKMSVDTLYLAVNYIDRFLSRVSVSREKLQLVGSSAMLIATKIEEIYPPAPSEWVYLTYDTYTERQVLKMEQTILKELKFELTIPTSYTFLRKLCAEYYLDETTTHFAMFLSELVLLEGREFLIYKPSELAAASILYARANLLAQDVWPSEIEKTIGYDVKHLSPIVKAQSVTLKESPNKSYSKAIREKYLSSKFGEVALLKQRNINFDFLESDCSSSDSSPENNVGKSLL